MSTACECGHAIEEHGHDPENFSSTACTECECIAFDPAEEDASGSGNEGGGFMASSKLWGDGTVFAITINGRERDWDGPTINHDNVVYLAGLGKRAEAGEVVTVTFRDSRGQGSLCVGQAVSVVDGMVFNAAITGGA